jgi:hypothetical protein
VSELYALIAMGHHCPPRIAELQDCIFAAGKKMGSPAARMNLLARLFRNCANFIEDIDEEEEASPCEGQEYWPKATREELDLILQWIPATTKADLDQLLADYPHAVRLLPAYPFFRPPPQEIYDKWKIDLSSNIQQ